MDVYFGKRPVTPCQRWLVGLKAVKTAVEKNDLLDTKNHTGL